MTKATVYVTTMFIMNTGVDYTFSTGSVRYESWKKAFEAMGYEQVSRDSIEPHFSGDLPRDVLDDNTYNHTTNIYPDIRFGRVDVPPDEALDISEEEGFGFAGNHHLLAFQVHRGGDIRGNYTKATYMMKEGLKEESDIMFIRATTPSLQVHIDSEMGEADVEIDPHGYPAVVHDEIGGIDADKVGEFVVEMDGMPETVDIEELR